LSGAARYCREREIDPLGLNIEVETTNDPETRMMTKLTYIFSFPAGISEEHKAGIMANTANCYVKKHMTAPPEVVVK